MGNVLTDIGEEHFVKNGLLTSMDFSTYDDSTDLITASDDLAAITTEPSTGGVYARQSATPTANRFTSSPSDGDADWGFTTTQTFDTSDVSQTVDSGFIVVNFLSSEAGDASSSDHLHSTPGPFSQSRDLSQIDTLDVTYEVTVS